MQLEKRYHATGDKITETYGDACNTTCTHFLVCDDLTKKCICAPRMLYKDGFCIRSRAYDIGKFYRFHVFVFKNKYKPFFQK